MTKISRLSNTPTLQWMMIILVNQIATQLKYTSTLPVCEPVVEEVVETEAITLATADGQIVRVISKEQYDRWGGCFFKNYLNE